MTRPLLLLLTAPMIMTATSALTYVSATGDDSNNCVVRAMPCRTFSGALAKTTSGGTVWVVDTGDFGGINITMPVTIDGGASMPYVDGVNVNTAGVVIVRNLMVVGSGGGLLIYADSGANLRLENVTISGTPGYGVVCRNGSTCSLDRVRIQNAAQNGTGAGVLAWGSKVLVSNSQITNCEVGVGTIAGGLVQLTGSIVQNNIVGVSTNGYGNLFSLTPGTIRMNGNTITDNTIGLHVAGTGAAIVSFGNNTIFGNTTNGNPTLVTVTR
ncbi:MAG TPA: right-handed parallel beta-helix repeat-containing protein [Candidatus Sulfopaludibacter sp.]|nr:right-handed parallel beta-helix repeat-containing protein [Candidatus Sulfopaludibacter sp.]